MKNPKDLRLKPSQIGLIFALLLSACGALTDLGGQGSGCGPLQGRWDGGSSVLSVTRGCEFSLEVSMGGSCRNTGLVRVTSETQKTATLTVTSVSGPSENLCWGGGNHSCRYELRNEFGTDYLSLNCEAVDPLVLVRAGEGL